MRLTKPTTILSALLALATLVGCGQAGLPVAAGARDAGFAPSFGVLEAADATADDIAVAFNDAYAERIDLNKPKAMKNPYNTDKGLLKLLKNAKQSIDGAFYDIEDPGVTEAMVAAAGRGVRVRLVTDTDNMVEKGDPSKPRAAIVKLKAAGVPVVDDQRSGIMHHKFMVVDGNTIWTGSTNLTPTSLYCHNNNALTIHSAQLAGAYTQEFERLFVKREFGKAARHGDTAPSGNVSTSMAQVQAYFSPAGGGREAVVAELRKAKKRIRFMTFSLTDIETGDTIMERAKAGVEVDGVFDRWLAAGQYSLYSKFKQAGFKVYKDGNEALMHHKVILIDDSVLITGSYNYSQNAEMNNNEAFLIIKRAPRLVRAYAREFDRLTYAAIHNRPPAAKRPDVEVPTGEGP